MARDTARRIDTVPTPRASDVDVAVTEPVGVSTGDRTTLPAGTSKATAASDATTASDAAAASEAATPTTTVKPRRGPAARGLSAGARPAGGVPQQPSASSPLVATTPVRPATAPERRHRVRRTVWIAVAAAVVVALGSGSAVYASEAGDLSAQDAELDATVRVDGAVLASSRDDAVDQDADRAGVTAALAANRARAAAQAKAVVDKANAVLAATPNAGDGPRRALGAATSALAASIAAPATSAATVRDLAHAVAAPQQAATDGQATWQATENARIAAEQAAAAQQAAGQAYAGTGTRPRSTVRWSAPRTTAPRVSSGGSVAPPAAAPSGVPAGGKVCSGSGGSGASESSVAAIGAAINAYRASRGLSRLSVSRSGTLVGHAVNMANTGGIWHSGSDNIVACVSSGSASAMVSAWSHSPPHDAQMRRTDVSSMAVGGASLRGWLFGAVKFN
ncbi:hypothetical protein [Cellulomonas sp. URHD0024]|uniref:CAP domain-containing protein n=1 Tax=Cellulomonas sp. URHD0024 TaxID=1302620 RepID=UPI0003FC5DFB|nr:hypothetical protein [Cellulomonas sp. URHD0024]